ncbi:hypothetical protein DVA81_19350 [Acinetobacter baumannii]|nr:hypothetical protein DVA81_19350 [Acinetobacter baumannii]
MYVCFFMYHEHIKVINVHVDVIFLFIVFIEGYVFSVFLLLFFEPRDKYKCKQVQNVTKL